MFTSPEARSLAGCTQRQLDYMVRCDVIHPYYAGAGQGTRMLWTPEDVRVLTVFAALRQLGATQVTLRPLEEELRSLTPTEWTAAYIVCPNGNLVPIDALATATTAGWVIDLERLVPEAVAVAA